MLFRRILAIACLLAALAACSDNDRDDSPDLSPAPPAAPSRGDLLESPPALLRTYTPGELLALAGQNDLGAILLDLAFSPKCSVSVHRLRYQTVGAMSEGASASGALMLPAGTDPACQGARPIVLYAHGTTTDLAYNIANLTPDNVEGVAIASVFAAQGYIVIAPNYAGYDTSSLGYHPYLIADQQSKDMIDALRAGRGALPTSSAPTVMDNGKLFITGYSQGGYVAMATHRALQAQGGTITAAAPMSGPYALSAFGDAIFQGRVTMSAPVNLTLLITAYDRAYGDIFTNTTDVFEAKYASGIDSLLPSATPLDQLEAQARITNRVVFNSTPPTPAYALLTPAIEPVELASVFAEGFGADFLISNAYRLSYLQDAETAPDGGFPVRTDGLPPANPTHALRRALKTNDLRTWAPNAPVLLCGGSQDPTVLFLNTRLMQEYWAASAPTASVTVLNLDASPQGADPYADLRNGFQAAKDLVRTTAVLEGATDGGDAAVFEAYHAGLVPPFCLSAVKSFFDAR